VWSCVGAQSKNPSGIVFEIVSIEITFQGVLESPFMDWDPAFLSFQIGGRQCLHVTLVLLDIGALPCGAILAVTQSLFNYIQIVIFQS